jgi:hypothetical protein
MSRVSQARNLGKYFLLIDNMLVVLAFLQEFSHIDFYLWAKSFKWV